MWRDLLIIQEVLHDNMRIKNSCVTRALKVVVRDASVKSIGCFKFAIGGLDDDPDDQCWAPGSVRVII